MALNVGELVAYMHVDDKGVAQGVQSGERRLKGFGSTATKVAAGIGTAFAALGAAFFVKDVIHSASDLNETQSKIQNQFGKSADAILAWSKTADGAIGQSQQAALDAASTFAVFGKAASLTGQDLVAFSTKTTTLASDLASFFNVDPSAASEAISAALRGENEPIRQFGVLLDENVVKAEAVRKGIVKAKVDINQLGKAQFAAIDAQKAYNDAVAKHGKSSVEAAKAGLNLRVATQALQSAVQGSVPDLTKQQQILATQAAIIDQTADAQGDFARTSGGLANQQRILAARFDNVKVILGQQLLPIALKFANVLQSVLKWGEANKSWLLPVLGILAGLSGTIWLLVKATQAWTAVQIALDVAMDANPIGLIVLGIAALIAVFILLWTHSAGFRDFWIKTWHVIRDAALAVGHWFAGPFAGFFVDAWHKIVDAAKAVGGWFAGPFAGFFVAMYHGVVHWLEGIPRWFTQTVPDAFNRAGHAVYDAVTWPFKAAAHWIEDNVVAPQLRIGARVADALVTGKDRILAAFRAIVNGIINLWNGIDVGIHLHIPSWVPGVGGEGFDISDIFPDIPNLARGGTFRPRPGGTVARVAEAGQVEVVSPVPTMRKVMAEELAHWAGGGQVVTLILDGRGVMRGVRKVVRIGGGRSQVLVGGPAGGI